MCDEIEDETSLETSQLDVISCGLGASALLALVFSVVKEIPPVNLSSPPFVKVVVATDSKECELAFLIQAPNMEKPELIHAHQHFDESGQLLSEKVAPLQQYGSLRIQRSVSEVDRITTQLFLHKSQPSAFVPAKYVIKVENPIKGKWRFNLVYSNQSTHAWKRAIETGSLESVQLFTITDTRSGGMREKWHERKLTLIDKQLQDWIEIDVD